MIKIKIKKSSEKMIGGAGDYRPDSDFDTQLLNLAIDKEISDHGIDPERAKEVAKDEFTIDDASYSKEVKKRASRKLSEYWRQRARRRANNSKRSWPNAKDYNWALTEQAKSKNINRAIYNLFEKELTSNEEIDTIVEKLLEKIKNNRINKMKIQKFGPGTPNKSKGSISKYPPEHKKGEGVAGRYRKVSKKMGGATLAPGESFGE